MAAAYPVHLQQEVEGYLAELRFAESEPATAGLDEAMRYSLLAGGKRIRPVLSLATAEALGRDRAEVMPFAAAIELIHTYSLIHDDLPAMDDDDLRRGQPTCHVKYNEGVAILAALGRLVSAAGVDGMVGGQYMDVEGETGDLRRLHELKTGRLIAASVDCVPLLYGLTGPATIALGRFAAELGVLFQIVDDILDVTGEEAALGKPQGSDERHGKLTYVSLFGLDRARELAAESHRNARAALAESGFETETLDRITDYILTRTS